MKHAPILPDPLVLRDAGLCTLTAASCLIHVGRCGLAGTTIIGIAQAIRVSPECARNAAKACHEVGLITTTGRDSRQGRPGRWIVTEHGWQALTYPVEFPPYPHQQTPTQ